MSSGIPHLNQTY